MYNGATVGVVVPAYNEAAFVGGVIDSMPDYVDRVYPVDDCSTDETWAKITARVEAAPAVPAATDGGTRRGRRIVPITHDTNRGRGAAVKTGYRRAIEDGVDVAAVMDGDGQMDPRHLDRLLEPVVVGGVGYAKGNRLGDRDDWRGMSPWRLFGNLLLSVATKVASGYWSMWDSQNGFTAVSADVLETIDLRGLYDQYGFLNDMLIELNVHDVRITDVEMPAVYGDEESGIRYSSFVPSLSLLLLRGFLYRLYGKYVRPGLHPLALLYGLGAMALGVAGLTEVRCLLGDKTDRARDVALVGLLSTAVAVLGDWLHNDRLCQPPRPPEDR